MAFAPGWPGTEMPYSVSVPMTRRTLIVHSLVPRRAVAGTSRALKQRPAAGKSCAYRYWPVLATVSIERPASVPCLPETSVRM